MHILNIIYEKKLLLELEKHHIKHFDADDIQLNRIFFKSHKQINITKQTNQERAGATDLR